MLKLNCCPSGYRNSMSPLRIFFLCTELPRRGRREGVLYCAKRAIKLKLLAFQYSLTCYTHVYFDYGMYLHMILYNGLWTHLTPMKLAIKGKDKAQPDETQEV